MAGRTNAPRLRPWLICAASAASALLVGSAVAQDPLVVREVPVPVADRTSSLASGDFDQDGNFDVAVAVFGDERVLVLFGDGARDFPTQAVLDTGFPAGHIVAADFDGDGALDVAATGTVPQGPGVRGVVRVYLGAGDGTFSAATQHDSCSASNDSQFLAADLDGDGAVDLSVIDGLCGGFGHVSVLLGHGDGTFAPELRTRVDDIRRVALGDFTGDGITDAMSTRIQPDTLALLVGVGDGTFIEQSDFDDTGLAVVADDFDHDGAMDFATVRRAVDPLGGALLVYLGNGDGTFAAPLVTPTGALRDADFRLADVNGDGETDIVALLPTGPIVVLLGAGDGTFEILPSVANLGDPRGLAAEDFDNDGDTDLAVANFANDGNVTIFSNNAVNPRCPADCDRSGVVDFNDLISILFNFGEVGELFCNSDTNGLIDFNDLVAALFLFGACPG